jgi:hypothetical protein
MEALVMARQMRRTNPGDAANIFVRCLLADASELLGGFTDDEWRKTLDYFGNRCVYTDELVSPETVVRDHAIPINQVSCGLHLFGNVLPCTAKANQDKAFAPYHSFVTDPVRLARIETFIDGTGYRQRLEKLGDLRRYCATQYEVIKSLCKCNRNYLAEAMGMDLAEAHRKVASLSAVVGGAGPLGNDRDRLPIDLDPSSPTEFRRALLQSRCAWLTILYSDGQRQVKPWSAGQIKPTSNILGNLRSRPAFRSGEWQRLGIVRVRASIIRPPDQVTAVELP